jgi:hypothetical protein
MIRRVIALAGKPLQLGLEAIQMTFASSLIMDIPPADFNYGNTTKDSGVLLRIPLLYSPIA